MIKNFLHQGAFLMTGIFNLLFDSRNSMSMTFFTNGSQNSMRHILEVIQHQYGSFV